jgi:uncharacterized protein
MWIRFSDILQTTQFKEPVGPLKVDMGYQYQMEVERLVLEFQAEPVEGGHRLTGGFRYEATLPCARCLKPAEVSGEARFDLLYVPAPAQPAEVEEVDPSSSQADLIYYHDDKLALDELVSQQMYLEVPDKVLCQANCRGLCPSCGADLNEGLCACPPASDERWAQLAQFVPKEKES